MAIAGVMEKLGGGSLRQWQRRYFVLRGTSLDYFDTADDKVPTKPTSDAAEIAKFAVAAKQKGTIDVTAARVLDRGAFGGGAPSFSVDGRNVKKGHKEYFLRCPGVQGSDEKWQWLHALMAAAGRYPFLAEACADDSAKTLARIRESKLGRAGVIDVPGNDTCADCDAPLPTWTINGGEAGAFICIECVGVHRSLWANRCKEVHLDEWRDDEVAFITDRGNRNVNATLEAMQVPGAPPKPVKALSSRAVREAFIKAKYDLRTFAAANKAAGDGDGDAAPATEGAVAVGAEGLARDSSVSAEAGAAGPTGNTTGAAGSGNAPAPGKYAGVLMLMLEGTTGASAEGAVACLANGFQHVESKPAKAQGGADGAWNEMLSLGTDTLRRPLALTFTDEARKDALGAAEIELPEGLGGDMTKVVVPLQGPMVKGAAATVSLSVLFNALT